MDKNYKYLKCLGATESDALDIRTMLQMKRMKPLNNKQPMTQEQVATAIITKLKEQEGNNGQEGTSSYNIVITKQKISDWETGRLKKIPTDVFNCWLEVLGLEKEKDCNLIAFPKIHIRALDNPMMLFTIGFLNYMNEEARKENIDFSSEKVSSFMKASSLFEKYVLDYLNAIRSEYDILIEEKGEKNNK